MASQKEKFEALQKEYESLLSEVKRLRAKEKEFEALKRDICRSISYEEIKKRSDEHSRRMNEP